MHQCRCNARNGSYRQLQPGQTVGFGRQQEEGYWERFHLLRPVKERAQHTATTLCRGYRFLFLFENATMHAIYSEDALRLRKMNKGNKGTMGQKPFLRDGWFKKKFQRHS